MKVPLSLLLAVALAACAPFPRPRPAPPEPEAAPPPGGIDLPPYRMAPGVLPRSAEEISGPAVLSLLNRAEDELNLGRTEQAIAVLERAQRIEPRNPFVWQQLAVAHLRQYRVDEAEDLAQRSNSLARGNPYVEIENWRVIASARQARGDAAGALEAEARVAQMEPLLD